MARTVNEIQATIIETVQAQPELAGASSDSKRAIWRLWTFVVATAIAFLEQLMDIFIGRVETQVSQNPPETALWVQNKVLEFQYDAANPQYLEVINLVPQYPTVDPELRIVTRCSVKSTLSNRVDIKVAKSEPPEPLDSGELDALQSYIDAIGVAGIYYNVVSMASDKMYIDADIYYNGMFSAVIQDNVIAAIEAYFSSIPFDGVVKISDLENAIKQVEGVNDVVLNNVRARRDSIPLSSASYLIQNSTMFGRLWNTVAGYIVGETTSGNTLADTLNFVSE